MYQRTPRLDRLMKYYDIANLPHGIKEDKLGDVFEYYCVELLESETLLHKAQTSTLNSHCTDDVVFELLCNQHMGRYLNYIRKISATNSIKHRITGGNPKTHVIADIELENGSLIQLPISVKQTTAPKVAMAEFDVDTIVNEIGITDPRLIELLEKHQKDASAKNFTLIEKQELKDRLNPYARAFVRWVVTGTPEPSNDLRFPEILLKFKLSKSDEILDINCFSADNYVDFIMTNSRGNRRSGGFGTGLGWTYATGSKGEKIQFKG